MKRDLLDSVLCAVIMRLWLIWEVNTVLQNLVVILSWTAIFFIVIQSIKYMEERIKG